jgi:Tol biopolymer transport system component
VPAEAAISRHGRFVAITVEVILPDPGHRQVAYWDRRTATATPVSVSATGDPGNRGSRVADISLDGRYVLFTSGSSNLVPGDTNGRNDAFLRDMHTGTTQRVSLSSAGNQLDGRSEADSLTADGHIVVFSTLAQLVPRDRNQNMDVYARNLITGETSLVSRNNHGDPGNLPSNGAVASDNGRWVAFLSHATNLAPGDRGFGADVFLRDQKTGHTWLASVRPARLTDRGRVFRLGGISGDGKVVAFTAFGEIDGTGSVIPFVYRHATGKARNVLGYKYLGRRYGFGNVNSLHGNVVTIVTDASLTGGDDRPGLEDVYSVRMDTGRYRLLTPQNPSTDGRVSIGPWSHMLSRDGHVLFLEIDAQLTSEDTDQTVDAYLRDIP